MIKKIIFIVILSFAVGLSLGYAKDKATTPEQKFLNDINNYQYASEFNMFNNERIIFYGKQLCKNLDKHPAYDALVTFVWDHPDVNSTLGYAIIVSAAKNLCPQHTDAVNKVIYEYNVTAML